MNDSGTPVSRTRWYHALPVVGVAVVATAVIIWSVAANEGHQAPGVTLDEAFNVQQGVRMVRTIPTCVQGGLTLEQTFGDTDDLPQRRAVAGYHLPDHPPLGRVWLGLTHELTVQSDLGEETDFGGNKIPLWSTRHARIGSAVAFGLTILLVGLVAVRWYGPLAGFAAAFALATMPRLFGHAHLAALETFTSFTFTAAVLAIAGLWKDRAPSSKVAACCGVIYGLALLSKIQAVLIPIPLVAWAVWRYRAAAVRPLIAWGLTAAAVFFVGWPWLWIDPLTHTWQYFAQTTDRVSLKVFYFGTTYVDRDTPWHYPFVMFLITVPIGWQLLGILGAAAKPAEPGERARSLLLGGVMLLALTLFAIPGIVVYDGARLFLPVFPLWAIFIGRGAVRFRDWLTSRWNVSAARWALALVMASQTVGVVWHHPAHLSYYNTAIGGLWGAEKLGLEPTYWGDSLSTAFLERVVDKVPEKSTVHVSPVLHQLYLSDLRMQSPVLQRAGITLQPYDPKVYGPPKYVLFFRRRADLFPELETGPPDAKLIAEYRVQGVLLAGLYEFAPEE